MVKNIKKNTPKRPKPIRIGDKYTLRVSRGPKEGTSDIWYWRLLYREHKSDKQAFSGWFSLSEAIARAENYASNRKLVDSGTVEEIANKWFQTFKNRKKNPPKETTIRTVRSEINKIISLIGGEKIEEVTTDLLLQVREDNVPENISHLYWHNICIHGQRIWNYASVKSPWNEADFSTNELRYAREKNTPKSPEEIQTILDSMTGWHKTVLYICRYTGARVSEVASLTWDRVDFKNDTLTVIDHKHTPKNGPNVLRTVPLFPELKEYLSELPRESDRVVNQTPQTIIRNANVQLTKVCKDLGFPHYTTHAFRRYVVTDYRRRNIPVDIAAKALGHSVSVMLEIYNQISTDDIKNAINAAYSDASDTSGEVEQLKAANEKLTAENNALREEVMKLQRKLLKLLSD